MCLFVIFMYIKKEILIEEERAWKKRNLAVLFVV